MKLGIVKTVTKALTKSKNTIVKHAPQIMAVAGAACFIGATVCAIKETPKAMEKLEEKKKLDSNMTTLQKMAVVGPEYKKTIALTAAGIVFTGLSWRFEAKHVATLTAALSGAVKEKDAIIEASKQINGEEKTNEVVSRAAEIKDDEIQAAENGVFDTDDMPYPFEFPNGTKLWMTWADFKRHNNNVIDKAAEKRGLKLSDYLVEFGMKEHEVTSEMEQRGWQPDPSTWAVCDNSKDWWQWASEIGEYKPEAYTYDKYRHIPGWKIEWVNPPMKWDDTYTGY